jgi:hypothetical protein
MKELLDAYYDVRRQNETLKGNITLLQAELKRVKENYDYIVNMSDWHKDISEDEKIAEIARGKVSATEAKIDYEYDTGRIIPRDDSQNWG